MDHFYRYIMESMVAGKIDREVAARVLKAVMSANREGSGIAVIGAAINFPGAKSLPEFWEVIAGGVDCVRPFPAERRSDTDAYLAYTGRDAGTTEYVNAAYLDDVDRFDYRAFRLSPKEASLMDPAQRLFLQTAWHAVEDAGYGGGRLKGTRTGVYVGFANYIEGNYAATIRDIDSTLLETGLPGNIPALMPGRISYLLDLKGPSMLLDTACSSSLVAVYTACQAIRNGECDMALAGGVRLSLLPLAADYLKIGVEAQDDRTRAFDEHSSGASIGEGIGAVLLKPLEKAIQDGDNIYAVIRGGAVNQDGTTMSLTAPNPAAQEEVIVKAWTEANINPESLSFIEVHGTGTRLGDPIEIEGLERAFRQYTDRKQFCAIGSVKTNIGHLNETAGMAGFIKAILALKRKELPPSINFGRPNSSIDFSQSPVYFNTRVRHWDSGDQPRLCGVSAFGLSGTNCHIVLEEYLSPEHPAQEEPEQVQILPLSARTQEGLLQLVQNYRDFLMSSGEAVRLTDVAWTAAAGRDHYGHRLALVVRDLAELKDSLRRICEAGLPAGAGVRALYGWHKISNEQKEIRTPGEITPKERGELTRLARGILQQHVEGKWEERLALTLGQLYVSGAEVQWDCLFAGRPVQVVSLPGYPFERHRCWVDIPQVTEAKVSEEQELFELTWREAPLRMDTATEVFPAGDRVLVLRPEGSPDQFAASVIEELHSQGHEVVEVLTGCPRLVQESDLLWRVGATESDYRTLLTQAAGSRCSLLWLHSSHRTPGSLDDLQEVQRRGVFSLFCLTRAVVELGLEARLLVAAFGVHQVAGHTVALDPSAAPLFGFSKVIQKELPQIQCRRVDLDTGTGADIVVAEWLHGGASSDVAYRNGIRHELEFAPAAAEIPAEPAWHPRKDGVYLISGGAGGIGLEVARYLAQGGSVKLALINRSALPDRSQWETIADQPNHPLQRRVKQILELEAAGAEVSHYAADVSDLERMVEITSELRTKYGAINGVIHGAGVAKDVLVEARDPDDFYWDVFAPKVYGAWVLDAVTQQDNLDFFVMFSSVALFFPAKGQGEYAAANAYLDAFAAMRSLQGKRTLTINWTTWKETGMAYDHGFTVDTIFKAMPSAFFMERFVRALGCPSLTQVLIGELNYDGGGVYLLERAQVRLAPELRRAIDQYKASTARKTVAANRGGQVEASGVTLAGKGESGYTEVERVLAGICQQVLGLDYIDIYDNFFEIGADSILLMRIQERVLEHYPGKIGPTDLFAYPSIFKLAEHISSQIGEAPARLETTTGSAKRADSDFAAPDQIDIAIIGMAARLPTSNDLADFWESLRSGADLTGEIPPSRLPDIERYLSFKGFSPDDLQFHEGAYLDHIDGFDYAFFRLAPREAVLMDPNQRLALMTAWQAVEDAGYAGGNLAGTKTAVYFGFTSHVKDMYSRYIYEVDPASLAEAELGNTPSVLSGRMSYLMDLKGPSMVVDTACSSSLAAIHLAVQALKRGECEMALTGAIKTVTLPLTMKEGLQGVGIGSSDGKTRSFDALSDGTTIGEGVVAFLLKPLSAALRDGDNIHAVIKGTAANQDGSSAGLSAPNPAAQEEVIIQAWEDAGVHPETISYVEAHGTGTQLGDPIEVKALQQAFSRYTDKRGFCALGSVKANIGHLSECAGMVGILKAVLAMKHRELPPNIYFRRPNGAADFVSSPLYVNTAVQPWSPDAHPRRCGVSAFGVSGTNAHVVLEEAPSFGLDLPTEAPGPQVFVLSARTQGALQTLVDRYTARAGDLSEIRLSDICYTAATGRGHYNYRLALVADDSRDFQARLEELRGLEYGTTSVNWLAYGHHRVVSDDRVNVASGELSRAAKAQLDREAAALVERLAAVNRRDKESLRELCSLYARGADVDWSALFEGAPCRKVSLPTYPFEETRCWLEVEHGLSDLTESETTPMDGNLFYTLSWRREEAPQAAHVESGQRVLLLAPPSGDLHPLISQSAMALRRRGYEVVEARLPQADQTRSSHVPTEYAVAVEQQYRALIEQVGETERLRILHLATLPSGSGIADSASLEEAQQRGLYSLYHLTRAFLTQGLVKAAEILLVSERVHEVTCQEEALNPQYATLFGLGKVIGQEYSNLQVRCVDIDGSTSVNEVLDELTNGDRMYQTAYRNGRRYVQVLTEVEPQGAGRHSVSIRQGALYLITGGTGGIGLAMAKHLASKERVRLALVSRSGLPERNEWDQILADGSDERLCSKIRAVREIERMGSEVLCFRADVSRREQIGPVIEELRCKFGRIRGVLHGAGVAGASILLRKGLAQFQEVINPKVQGTLLLDQLTRPDSPDFFALFSSAATLTGEAGMGDYVAANSFQDAFSAYRNRTAGRTLTINWVSWRDAGMSVEFGVNVDTVFKALPTDTAVDAFDRVLDSTLDRVIVGELNQAWFEQLASVAHLLPHGLSERLSRTVKAMKKADAQSGGAPDVALVEDGRMAFLPMATMAKLRRGGDSRGITLRGKDGEAYSDIERKLAAIYSTVLGFEEIDVHDSFFELGGDSILLGRVHTLLEKEYPGLVRLTDLFEHTSVEKLSRYVQSLTGAQDTSEIRVEKSAIANTDIAIVGVGFKMAGIDTLEDLWEVVREGADCVSEFPESRRTDIDRYTDLLHEKTPGGLGFGDSLKYHKGSYFEDVAGFDHKLFRVTPKEAALMDPSQRAFMEVTWKALEDAGYLGRTERTRTGVYVGYAANPVYQRMIYDVEPALLGEGMIGNIAAMMPGRIAHLLDLKGSNMVLDTACSSSLVAVHLACQALRTGECDMAVAGGLRLHLLPLDTPVLKVGFESQEGFTRTFDEGAGGAGTGEGVAALILKPLEQAVRDRDQIYAVIKGSAINQDGRSMTLTAPNPSSQADVISEAWDSAQIDPETISYIEAHGTATGLGDPIEVSALTRVFARYTDRKQFCAIGSIKANLGHLYECAGMAGLLKALLVIKHREIPPSIHFHRPNSKIDFCNSAVYVNTVPRRLDAIEGPIRCGVSAFGLSGTNGHIVLEEYRPVPQEEDSNPAGLHILPISARSEEALLGLVRGYSDLLEQEGDTLRLADVAGTAATGRLHFEHRVALAVQDIQDLRAKLASLGQSGLRANLPGCFYSQHKVVLEEKEVRAPWEITNREKARLSERAGDMLQEFRANRSSTDLATELCQLYVSGAEVDWEQVYADGEFERVSLPTYPFERHRCWVEYERSSPRPKADDSPLFELKWREAPLDASPMGEPVPGDQAVVFVPLGCGQQFVAELSQRLQEQGMRVVLARTGCDRFEQQPDGNFLLGEAEADFAQVLATAGSGTAPKLFYLALTGETTPSLSVETALAGPRRATSDLYNLSRVAAELNGEVDLLLVARNLHMVTSKDAVLCPDAAPAFGFSRVLQKEYPNIRCRRIDLDEHATVEELIREWQLGGSSPDVAYRNGTRFEPEFSPLVLDRVQETPWRVREDGVYLVSGGAGGIGLEVARHLASLGRVRLALVNRSVLPDRSEWDAVLKQPDHKLHRRIQAIRTIEALGAEITFYQADVSDLGRMTEVAADLRRKYGRINGVIHAAGVSRDQPLANRPPDGFQRDVYAPKVDGTLVLDHITQQDELDFFLLFSSVATMFPTQGQGEYVAANAYLDAFAAWRTLQGRHTMAINWTTWKETGMAYDHGFTVDTIFKRLPTDTAISLFSQLLTKRLSNVLVGELNFETGGAYLLERSRVNLSPEVQARLKSYRQRSSRVEPTAYRPVEGVRFTSKAAGGTVEQRLAEICRESLGLDEIDIYDNFFELGADSVILIKIYERIDSQFPGRLAITDLFAHPNVFKLAQVMGEKGEVSGPESALEIAGSPGDMDMAIIGMAAELPSSASLEEFWASVRSGADLTGELPAARRVDLEQYLAFRGITPGVEINPGAYLNAIDKFDYAFFGLSPREAALMDPNQRLALMIAWKTVEDAGYGGGRIAGSNTGVYFAVASPLKDMYSRLIHEIEPSSMADAELGNTPAVLPGRISYLLDLKGPSMVIDTACSSSLTSIHLAVQALRRGECEMALVGGIKIITLPVTLAGGPKGIGMTSSDGKTRTFDARSSGTAMGEGVAAVLLKPLAAAVRDGDNIHAVIKGTAINQDGTSAGLSAPNPVAQQAVICRAWADAGVHPETISYIEAHGTGTPLGDPIELKALTSAFALHTEKRGFCAVGSVKANIGHLSECAGMAGLLKAVLALKHRELPPLVHFQLPNSGIDFADSALYVNSQLKSWEKREFPRRCGVSAFGVSGTNAHVVLEEAPPQVRTTPMSNSELHVLTLSAKTPRGLESLVQAYGNRVWEAPELSMEDICYTANTGRGHYHYRLALVAKDPEEFRSRLKELQGQDLAAVKAPWFAYGQHRVVADDRKNRLPGDITRTAQATLSSAAGDLLAAFTASGKSDEVTLRQLIGLYVQGADTPWAQLYEGEHRRKVSLPTYPFEASRCWIEVPSATAAAALLDEEADAQVGGLFYAMAWRPEPVEAGPELSSGERVLLCTSTAGADHPLAREMAATLRRVAVDVLELRHDGTEADLAEKYRHAFEQIGPTDRLRILHMSGLGAAGDISDGQALHEAQTGGMLSLYHLVRAFSEQNVVKSADILLVADRVHEVTAREATLNPQHASLFGLGKVVGQEYPMLRVKAIDIDEAVTAAQLLHEMTSDGLVYQAAYRDGVRFVQELQTAQLDNAAENEVEVQEGGLYLISGGTGGIGLVLARNLAAKKRVRLALVSRSGLPDRTEWDRILDEGADTGLCDKLRVVRQIEQMGSEVIILKADVSREAEIGPAIESLRERYGRISGVLHCAGVASASVLIRKEIDQFMEVINPKVHGTWLLDRLTRSDEPDFFVLCSSSVTLTGEASQGDYTAGNSFLDAYSAYRRRSAGRTLTINWVAWRDVGMSVAFGVNQDGLFKCLPIDVATDAFEQALQSSHDRLIVGEFNWDWAAGFAQVAHLLPYRLSEPLSTVVKRVQKSAVTEARWDSEVALIDNGRMTFLPRSTMAAARRANGQETVRLSGHDDHAYSEVETKLASMFGKLLGYHKIDIHDSFFELGGDSILLGRLYMLVEQEFPGSVRLVDLFQYPTVAKLAAHIQRSGAPTSGPRRRSDRTRVAVGDIAIIGMAFRLPGADSPEGLWELVSGRADCVRSFPEGRRADAERYLAHLQRRLGAGNLPQGGPSYFRGAYLDDVASFDHRLFRIPPREAAFMDPSQRAFLEVTWRAIEDAGYGGKIEGSNTGIWVGHAADSAYLNMCRDVDIASLGDAIMGNIAAVMPGRIAYMLDLHGPAMVVDAACSSSLVAIHQACQSLRLGECDMAIAGGVRLHLLPMDNPALNVGFESSDGTTRSFDAAASGAGKGEGVGAVVLKPLEQALRDGDQIHAVIKGSAVNQDGRSIGLAAPSVRAQEEVILSAWEYAGIDPEQLCYVEAQGTATPLGDLIEIEALTRAFANYTDRKQFCAVGSVKDHMGHLNEAAGMAGLLKALLVLKHKQIPPSIHFQRPNGEIDFCNSAVYVNTTPQPVASGGRPALCAVSTFGISGTNCHMVLEEYVPPVSSSSVRPSGEQVLVLSARSQKALVELARQYLQMAADSKEEDLPRICYTANTGRSHLNHRVALVVRDLSDLKDQLGAFLHKANRREIS